MAKRNEDVRIKIERDNHKIITRSGRSYMAGKEYFFYWKTHKSAILEAEASGDLRVDWLRDRESTVNPPKPAKKKVVAAEPAMASDENVVARRKDSRPSSKGKSKK